jgi:hypothetical protein
MGAQEAYGSNGASLKSLNPLQSSTNRRLSDLPKLEGNNIFAPKTKIGIEERALPALGRQTPLDFNKVNEQEFEHQKPDQINSSKLTLKVDKKLAHLVDKLGSILGDDLSKEVCADKWYFQQSGIESTVKSLQTHLEKANDSDKKFLVGFLADTLADVDMRSTNLTSLTNGRKIKKTFSNLKKRLELFESLISESKSISMDLCNEVFKRLTEFVDYNPLKQDLISTIDVLNKNHGFEQLQPMVSQMADHQLEQLKDCIPEVQDLLKQRQEEQKRKKEQMAEEKKRISVEPAKFAGRKKSSSKPQDFRLK